MDAYEGPLELSGEWDFGFALDYHVDRSEYDGKNVFGYDRYNNTYTPIGELLNKIKYSSAYDKIAALTDLVVKTIDYAPRVSKETRSADVILPVPPSNLNRSFQPVYEIAKKIGKTLEIPVRIDKLKKIEATKQVKNLSDKHDKQRALRTAFQLLDAEELNMTRVLLFDDLFQTGATMSTLTELIRQHTNARVIAMALTKTRR
jgi:predicted amidophosphoribosyltransferase